MALLASIGLSKYIGWLNTKAPSVLATGTMHMMAGLQSPLKKSKASANSTFDKSLPQNRRRGHFNCPVWLTSPPVPTRIMALAIPIFNLVMLINFKTVVVKVPAEAPANAVPERMPPEPEVDWETLAGAK